MSFYHSLIDLIKGLDKGRVRFVRSRLPHKQLRLFDFLSAQKKITSKEKIQAEIGTTAFGLDALLADLEKSIVSLIGEHAQNKRSNGEILRLTRLGHGYLEVNSWGKALEAFEQARAKAIVIGDYGLALQIAMLIKVYLPQALHPSRTISSTDISALFETVHLLRTQDQLRLIKRLPFSERNQEAIAIIESLKRPQMNPSNQILYYGILTMGYALMEWYTESIQSYKSGFEVIQGDIALLHNPIVLSASISSVIIASASTIHSDETHNGMLMLDRLSECLTTLIIPEPDRVRIHRLYMQTMEGRPKQTLDAVFVKAARIEREIENPSSDNMPHLLRLKYEIAVQFFRVRRFDESFKWIEKLLGGRPTPHKVLWVINASILYVVLLIELEDFDKLPLALRRANYAVSKIKSQSLIIKALQRITNTVLGQTGNKQQAAKNFLLEYNELTNEAKDLKLIVVEELNLWARSSLE